jgi:hypothetical protein
MLRLPLLLAVLAGCTTPETLPSSQLAAPQVTLDVPDDLVIGTTVTVTASGTLGEGEGVYFGGSVAGLGSGPCFAWAGGACFGIRNVVPLGVGLVDDTLTATYDLTVPATLPSGTDVFFQAVVVRGRNGALSVLSDVATATVVADLPGCTDPNAANFDPAATVDDGTCLGCGAAGGAFEPTADTTISGTLAYDSVTIPAGVTVTATGTAALDLDVCGPVVIDGVLDVSGGNGATGTATNNNPNGATGGAGGLGVAGGFSGGRGGNSQSGSGSAGSGPGAGAGGLSRISVQSFGTFYNGGQGGGAGHASAGTAGFTSSGTGTAGGGGSVYGDAELLNFPDVAGSGGGGGSGGLGGASTGFGGGGGGAGGGVVRITSTSEITINGSIHADGGTGAFCQDIGARGGGGAGSGGAVWLSAPTVTNNGQVTALGGENCFLNGGAATDGLGGDGRIRIDSNAAVVGDYQPAVGFVGAP